MRAVWAVVLGVLSGCAESGAAYPSAEADDGLPQVPRIFAEVSRGRSLAKHELPRVEFLRHRAYLEAHERVSKDEHSVVDRHASELGMAGDVEAKLTIEQVRALASDGFYARSTRTVYVLDDPSRRFPELQEQVVAHELIHALQDQNGLFPAERERFDDDSALARRALLEGDATLSVLLYEQRNWRTPVRRIAERVRRGFAEAPISRYVNGTNAELSRAPAYQQEMLLFPYRAGAAFVASVLTVGGYELLARVYAAPPTTTAQILHPERYARGEQPAPIPDPRPPSGYRLATRYVLGELLTRTLLMRCNPEARALAAAEGWRGDAVVTLSGDAGTLTTQQWVMDSERDARELADALRRNQGCYDAIGASQVIVQRGVRVVTARGAPPVISTQLANAWLTATIAGPVSTRPLGLVELPSGSALPDVRSASVVAGWLTYPAAGVELPVPPGFAVVLPEGRNPRLELESAHAEMEISLALGEYFEAAPEQILLDVSRRMALAIAYSNVVSVDRPYSLSTAIGSARAQDFEHEGTVFKGRVIAIPLCGGAAMVTVVQSYGTGGAEDAMKQAIARIRPSRGSTLCERLTR